MSKRRSGNKSEIASLLRQSKKIRSNFITNVNYIKENYESLFNKSSHYDRTLFGESEDVFEIAQEIAFKNVHRIDTNKAVRNRIKRFVKKYKTYGGVKKETALKRFTKSSRDEFVGNFRELGLDNKVFEFLEENGLWDDPNFWRSFFNSPNFTPLYQKYTSTTTSKFNTDRSSRTGSKLSFWGDMLYSYAHDYLKKRGYKINEEEFYKFKYTLDGENRKGKKKK